MFTAEELAAMAAADAEIDAEFEDETTAYRLAREDADYASELDKLARFDGLTNREAAAKRKAAAYQKAYREANKDEIAARQKAYREANKDEIAAYQKAYYEANKKRLKPLDALRIYRKEHGYTQAAFGQLLGVSQRTVSYWESGSVPPDYAKLATVGIMMGGDRYATD